MRFKCVMKIRIKSSECRVPSAECLQKRNREYRMAEEGKVTKGKRAIYIVFVIENGDGCRCGTYGKVIVVITKRTGKFMKGHGLANVII